MKINSGQGAKTHNMLYEASGNNALPGDGLQFIHLSGSSSSTGTEAQITSKLSVDMMLKRLSAYITVNTDSVNGFFTFRVAGSDVSPITVGAGLTGTFSTTTSVLIPANSAVCFAWTSAGGTGNATLRHIECEVQV